MLFLGCASLLLGLALALATMGACLIVDPPAELLRPPPHRPTIVRDSVFPPTTRVLSELPSVFLVPVDLIEQSEGFEWNVFTGNEFRTGGEVPADSIATDGGPSIVPFSLDPITDNKCHTIEFLVAIRFNAQAPRVPNPPGGDSVAWFYNPSGDLDGCPVFDAGILDGSFPSDGSPVDESSDAD